MTFDEFQFLKFIIKEFIIKEMSEDEKKLLTENLRKICKEHMDEQDFFEVGKLVFDSFFEGFVDSP